MIPSFIRTRHLQRIRALTLLLMALLLSGCAAPGTPETAAQPAAQAPGATSPLATAEPAAATAPIATTAPTAEPTAEPAAATAPIATAAPTAEPTAEPVPTEEPAAAAEDGWELLAQADLNGDGQHELIEVQPSQIERAASTLQGDYATYKHTIGAVRVRTIDGQQAALIAPEGVFSGMTPIASFGDSVRPAAFVLRFDAAAQVPVEVIQLNSQGEFYAGGIGIYWNAAAQSYQLAGAGSWPTPIP